MISVGIKDLHPVIKGAARGGHKELVEFCVDRGVWNHVYALEAASRGGHKELVIYFVKRQNSVISIKLGLYGAARGGQKEIIDYYAELGELSPKKYNKLMRHAAAGGHLELVKHFISLGANVFDSAILASMEKCRETIIRFLADQREFERHVWNRGLYCAARKDNRRLIDYCIEKGANDWYVCKKANFPR